MNYTNNCANYCPFQGPQWVTSLERRLVLLEESQGGMGDMDKRISDLEKFRENLSHMKERLKGRLGWGLLFITLGLSLNIGTEEAAKTVIALMKLLM